MNLVATLDSISAADDASVGGKAVALATLHRSGLAIPHTLCLTTDAYELFVEQSSLRAVIRQELGRKRFADMRWEELWDVALRIRNRFLRAPMPAEIKASLSQRLSDGSLNQRLVVRSSAPGEDSPEASFAGLHDSFINVQGEAAVIEAVQKVWASLWTDRALLYRRERNLEVNASAMAVVIQELVEGSSSGVAFAVHPADAELLAIEAVYGLNQGLVDGAVEPDRWSVERGSRRVVEHNVPSQRQRLIVRGSLSMVERVPLELSASPPLSAEQVSEVATVVTDLGDIFGAPQDMEWTLCEGRLVVLQSRPITTAATADGDKRAWYLSLTRSHDNLIVLRERVEHVLLPALAREADEIAARDLSALDAGKLAEEIDRRRRLHDRWVDVYTSEFIPLAHGIRLFGQFYNDVVRPEDPFEFMQLLAATPLLSVRRNQELAQMASALRNGPGLRSRLEAGENGDEAFEGQLQSFAHQYGDAAFGSERCFRDRNRLVRLLLSMADAPEVPQSSPHVDVAAHSEAFLAAVDTKKRELATQLLDLGRASYRLRDDDNIFLARIETLVLDAVAEGRRRLREANDQAQRTTELAQVVRALRHPNLVVEPRPAEAPIEVEQGFRALPRQLVGQPAGPGIASGNARVIRQADDLFRFKAGEILVCDAVDPNMTFVVPMAAAVVERRGGMLIHGAIIAREYGLACVTGVPEVTTLITTGDRLIVDGYLGILTVTRE